ncbi:MAG TPA: biopolymer transporter ExbD [Caulobacteraceae bacterium]|nr:biopolymer transporter ExbD [Caulobacteraceae bacterium]
MASKLGGKKGEKYELGQNADINVTPFVDVMLVLLIIFMVSIPVATTFIKIDLPPQTETQTTNDKPTYISIGQTSGLTLVIKGENTTTTLATLGDDLQRALGPTAKTQSVLIRADRLVKYKDFMSVVNQLQSDGYYKVALIPEDLNASTT